MLSNILFLTLLIKFSFELKLPSNFQKCNRKQPDLKECVLKAAQNGIPLMAEGSKELNLPSINPYKVIEATVGAGKGPVAVEQKFRSCELYGFTGIKLDQFEFNFEEKKLIMAGVFPEINMQCTYELDGRVLLLPIKGTGPSTIILKNLKFRAIFRYEEIKKRNKTFIKITSSDELVMDPELVHFNFENLLAVDSGNHELSNNINEILNDNWKEVLDDVKDGYIEIVKTIVISVFNNFFSRVSIEEAFD